MNGAIILDGRNLWDPENLKQLGFTYMGIGLGRLTKSKSFQSRFRTPVRSLPV